MGKPYPDPLQREGRKRPRARWLHQRQVAPRGLSGSWWAGRPFPSSSPPRSSWPTWSASASSPASDSRSRTSRRASRSCCYGSSAASSRSAACFPTPSSARCFRAPAANTISSAARTIRRSASWPVLFRRRSALPRPWRWRRWPSANTAHRSFPVHRRWGSPPASSGWCRWCNSPALRIPRTFSWSRPGSRWR